MARKLRIQYPGALYHVINRGNYRHDVFADAGAAQAFLKAVAETCTRHRWQMHAYMIMRNHFHLAVTTPEPNLVEGMHLLQSAFATRFNRYRSANGYLFQGRYKSILIEDAAALLRVVNYIHLNPVRAQIVQPSEIAAFPWSSLGRFVTGVRPTWLTATDWLSQLDMPDTTDGLRAYIDYLVLLAEDTKEQEKQGFGSLTHGWAIGTNGWKRAIAKKYGHLSLRNGMEREEIRELKEARWVEALESGLRSMGKSAKDAAAEYHYAPWKIVIARQLRVEAGASSRWICDRLHMGLASSLRSLLCRTAAESGLTP